MNNKSKFEEQVLSEIDIFKGKVINVELQTVKLPNNEISKREIVNHNGAVGIILIKNGKIALVRQWRAPMKRETLEIPAGKIDVGEKDLKKVAARELREETGYNAKKFEKVSDFFCSPGYSNEMMHMFFAVNPEKKYSDLQLDEDEFLNLEWLSLEETKKQIFKGLICDAKTMLALNYFEMKRDF